FAFTALMVHRLSQQVSATSEVLARLCAQASFGATRDPQLQTMLRTLIERIDFPIVITDERGVPRAWHGVGLAATGVPAEALDSLAQGLAVAPVSADRVARIRAQARQLDPRNAPTAMPPPFTGATLGRLHSGAPPLLERLRWMPYLTLGGLALLI